MKQFSVSRVVIKIQRGCSVGGLTLLVLVGTTAFLL